MTKKILGDHVMLRFNEDPNSPAVLETNNKRQAIRLIKAGAVVLDTTPGPLGIIWKLEMPNSWVRWPRAPKISSKAQKDFRSLSSEHP